MSDGLLIMAERVAPQRGGLAVATGRIAAHARAAGMRVHVVYPSRDLDPGRRGRRDRDDIGYHPFGTFDDDEATLRAWGELAAEVAEDEDLGLVHGIYATRAGYLATLVGQLRRLPSVVSIRGNDLDRGLYRARDLPLLDHALRRATRVTAVSAALATTAARVFERPVEHVTNAVDTTRFVPKGADNSLRVALGLEGATVLGFVGELRQKKGIQTLLPALDALLQRGRDVRLLLIGGVRQDARPAFEAFEAMAPEAFARIHVVDYDRDPTRLSALLGLVDLMVFPSLSDGTPNAVLEAMACARPILASDAGGQADLIEHGRCGALLSVRKLAFLADAIEEMLDLPASTRSDFGRAARARAIEHFSPAQERAAYQRIYAEARASWPVSPS